MATKFTLYKSTDASAPVVTGAAGAVTTLLDACLVNGYGSKAAAGWSTEYTGTNKRVYKQGAGSGFYYRVNDAAAGTGGAKEALVKGAESFSDVDTVASGPFPTVAQCALTQNSLVVRKSATADATARAWKVFADAKTAYVFIRTGDVTTAYMTVMIGDLYSLLAGDQYAAGILARPAENPATPYEKERFSLILRATYNAATLWAAVGGHYVCRHYAGTGGSQEFAKMQSSPFCNLDTAVQSWGAALPYPHGPDNGLWLARIITIDPSSLNVRGFLRGVWAPQHAYTNFSDGDVVDGTGALSGRSFEIVRETYGNNNGTGGGGYSITAMETTPTVE